MKNRFAILFILSALILSASNAVGAVSAGEITGCATVGPFYAGRANTVRVTVKATSGSGAIIVEPASKPSGWSISPSDVQTSNLAEGSSYVAEFTVTPPAHSTNSANITWEFYYDRTWPLSNVLLDSKTYSFPPKLPPCTVTAVVGADGGGTITPSSQTVEYGATATLTLTPYSKYSVSDIVGTSGGSWSGSSLFSAMTYTTGPVTGDLSLTANFTGWPDLTPSRLVVTNTSTSGWTNKAYAGDSLKMTAYIRNSGVVKISSPLIGSPASKTGFFLSTSATSTNGATELTNDWAPNAGSSIEIGAEDAGDYTYDIPSTIPPGTYYLLIYADYENNLEEFDEANNLLAYEITIESKYDLSVSRLILANKDYTGWTNRAYAGQKIQVTSYTKNTGVAAISSGAINPASKTGFFLSPSDTSTNGAVLLANDWAPNLLASLAVGAEDEGSETVTIPDWAPGTYYLLAVADFENNVNESNENNNILAIPFYLVGEPAFSNVEWWNPRDLTDGDAAMLYAEVLNIPLGATCTFTIYEDDGLFANDVVTNLTAVVSNDLDSLTNTVHVLWQAQWMEDQSGDPEFYFEVQYADVTAESLREDGEYLTVCEASARQTPSPDHGDFYYDPDGVDAGPATAKAALTDDRIPLIVVHGMGGDAKIETLNYWYGWVNSDTNGTMGYFNTPEMRSKYRVYRYVYDTRDFISTNAVKFADFVNNFYAENPDLSERQVIIMAHSMGGLVSRYAMNTNPEFRSHVQRLVTLGSPHLGSQGANPTWLRHAFATGFNTIVSTIYNVAGLHNNTAGCFDLAWYDINQIPVKARDASTISNMYGYYNRTLLEQSLINPFTGWEGMLSTTADPKLVLYGGHADGKIDNYMSQDWPTGPSKEVKTDHLGLWAAVMIFNNMHYENGEKVGDNDGLVPVNSALMTDANAHPTAEKLDLTTDYAEYVDHASYLDVASSMDYVKARLLTIIKTPIAPAAVTNHARWRIVGGDGHWQKPGVSLAALKPGAYTIEFSDVEGWTKPANATVTVYHNETTTIPVAQATYTEIPGNDAPIGLVLSPDSIVENSAIGTAVGTLIADDPDTDDAHIFALVSGEGDADNARFTISGNTLLLAEVPDFETSTAHTIRVRVTDNGGLWYETALTIYVLDAVEPVDFVVHPIQSLRPHPANPNHLLLSWEGSVDAGAPVKYMLYTSTNLMEGFSAAGEIENTNSIAVSATHPVMFWCIRPLE